MRKFFQSKPVESELNEVANEELGSLLSELSPMEDLVLKTFQDKLEEQVSDLLIEFRQNLDQQNAEQVETLLGKLLQIESEKIKKNTENLFAQEREDAKSD